jgi:hypothetical protein
MRFCIGLAILLTTIPTRLWAQVEIGVLRVSAFIEGTKTPIPDVTVSVSARIGVDCAECSLPDTEEDLFAYLQRLADAKPDTPTAVTDIEGHVVFRNLKPGYYDVVARRPGFLGPTLPDPFVESSSIVRLERESPNSQVFLFLKPTAMISGRVLDSYGKPIADVVVGGVPQDVGPIYSMPVAVTDALGEFSLGSLAPGRYVLRLTLLSFPERVFFFPGVTRFEEARAITLLAGDSVTRVDINLPSVLP